MRENATTIDIGNEYDGAIDFFSKPHIGDVLIAQVNFRRTSRALDNDVIVLLAKSLMRLQYRRHRHQFVIMECPGIEFRHNLAVDNHLCSGIAGGL